MIEIHPGNKYAVLGLRVSNLALRFTDELQLHQSVFATRSLPDIELEPWAKWLGSIQIGELKEANLIFLAQAKSVTPESIDGENEELRLLLDRLYLGLLIASPYLDHGKVMLITGVHHGNETNVATVAHIEPAFPPPGCRGASIDDAVLRNSWTVSSAIEALHGMSEHTRLWRTVNAFRTAIRSHDAGTRLHQCLRTVEGFIFPDEGNTRRQMKSRGELFLGTSQHSLVDNMFAVRSAVEHLHDSLGPVRAITSGDARLLLLELCYQSEAIARGCLQHLLATKSLWPHFKDDTALKAFWSLSAPERVAVWGPPFDLRSLFSHFDKKTAENQLRRL